MGRHSSTVHHAHHGSEQPVVICESHVNMTVSENAALQLTVQVLVKDLRNFSAHFCLSHELRATVYRLLYMERRIPIDRGTIVVQTILQLAEERSPALRSA